MNEDQNTEWKESWQDEHLKWLCAFANAQGGVLEVGRNDKGQVVGLDNAERLMEELPNKLRDLLGIVADINLLEENGLSYVQIVVEPYPVPISYRGKYHYRSGSTKQVLTGAALDRFLLGKTGKRWDAAPVPGVGVGDLDAGNLIRFRERATYTKRLGGDILDEDNIGLIEKLRLTEGQYLKRAAILLFHPDPERFFTGAAVRIGYFESETDLRYQDEICGDLFTQVDTTMDLLLTKYLKATISYEGIQRIETYPVPEGALREAVLNAIVHRITPFPHRYKFGYTPTGYRYGIPGNCPRVGRWKNYWASILPGLSIRMWRMPFFELEKSKPGGEEFSVSSRPVAKRVRPSRTYGWNRTGYGSIFRFQRLTVTALNPVTALSKHRRRLPRKGFSPYCARIRNSPEKPWQTT